MRKLFLSCRVLPGGRRRGIKRLLQATGKQGPRDNTNTAGIRKDPAQNDIDEEKERTGRTDERERQTGGKSFFLYRRREKTGAAFTAHGYTLQ
jgi:hypothetical protein